MIIPQETKKLCDYLARLKESSQNTRHGILIQRSTLLLCEEALRLAVEGLTEASKATSFGVSTNAARVAGTALGSIEAALVKNQSRACD